jgi:hypothetical protein
MAAHATTTNPDGSISFSPLHALVDGACGWTGRALTLDEEALYAEGQLEGTVKLHAGQHYLVSSFCQFVGEQGDIHVADEGPDIETRPPDGE